MKRSGIFFLCLMLISFSTALAAEISVPGRVSQGHAFPVSVQDDVPFSAAFLWRGETLEVQAARIPERKVWKAEILLALPLDAVKTQKLSVILPGGRREFSVAPMKVKWHESHLKVAPKYVEPSAEAVAQIERDRERSRQALAVRTEKRWTLPIVRPVPGGITSAFGGRRVFNGQPRAPHKGTDMRCSEGTPVKAVCAGTVLFAESTYFGGNTIYVDHGQGVISTYSHLSAFDVKAGDGVEQGQVIGRSGSTGRVTGPHLHFGFLVQGVAVDAMPLLSSPPVFTGGPSRSIFDQKPKAKKPRNAK